MLDHTIPTIDLELGKKLLNGNEEAAIEMLELLIQHLPIHYNDIKQAFDHQDQPALLRHVHKLHGAVCYVGVPRLKIVLKNFESGLKNNEAENIDALFSTFENEVKKLLQVSLPHA